MAGTIYFNEIVAAIRKDYSSRLDPAVEEYRRLLHYQRLSPSTFHLAQQEEARAKIQQLHNEMMARFDAEIVCKQKSLALEFGTLERDEIFLALTNIEYERDPATKCSNQEANRTETDVEQPKQRIGAVICHQRQRGISKRPLPPKSTHRHIKPKRTDRAEQSYETEQPEEIERSVLSRRHSDARAFIESAPGYCSLLETVLRRCTHPDCDWEFYGHHDQFNKSLRMHIAARHRVIDYVCQNGCGRAYKSIAGRKTHESKYCKGPSARKPRKASGTVRSESENSQSLASTSEVSNSASGSSSVLY
jgi:hypothetical protein